jgi:hypothetical protein
MACIKKGAYGNFTNTILCAINSGFISFNYMPWLWKCNTLNNDCILWAVCIMCITSHSQTLLLLIEAVIPGLNKLSNIPWRHGGVEAQLCQS